MSALRRIIALAGLSGAGKTTLIQSVAAAPSFCHLSASALIKDSLQTGGVAATSEGLRVGDIPDNQTQLVRAFERRSSETSAHIVLDCHTLIDTPRGLEIVPPQTFADLGVTDFLFLTVEPERLYERRRRDTSRNRPTRSVAELAEQQTAALEHARAISNSLTIPLIEIGDEPERELLDLLQSLPPITKGGRR